MSKKYQILVVDDSASVRDLVSDMLPPLLKKLLADSFLSLG